MGYNKAENTRRGLLRREAAKLEQEDPDLFADISRDVDAGSTLEHLQEVWKEVLGEDCPGLRRTLLNTAKHLGAKP